MANILNKTRRSMVFGTAAFASIQSSRAQSPLLPASARGCASTNSLTDWAGVDPTGTNDSSSAFVKAITSGTKRLHIPAGRYLLNPRALSNLVISNLSNIEITGDGSASVIYIASRNLVFKSPNHVRFKSLRFEANPSLMDSSGQIQSIWCSNFTDLTFDDCEFDSFGGQKTIPNGSTALYLYAGPSSSVAAAGNSTGALLNNCRFYGDNRKTNFGVRVFTEWAKGASLAYSNTGAIIQGCTFEGYNWNALELTGPMTSNVLVFGCVANSCGLTPFDIDKGATNSRIQNITINRLLGNADTKVSPSTRACVVEIQGETNVGRIAQNCHIDGVVANLLAADISAFAGFGGFSAFGYSNAKNCSIKNVKVNIDSVPIKNTAASWAFAVGCFESVSGCETEDIATSNATHGIMETSANFAGVGTDWNVFRKIQNRGTLKGECIWIGKNSAQVFKHRFEDVKFTTDMSARAYDVPAVNLIASAPSPTAISLERVYINTIGYSVINPNIANLSLRDFYVDYSANNNHLIFFTSGNSLSSIHYGGAWFNGKPLDVYSAFQRLSAKCYVNSAYMPDLSASLVNGGGGIPMYATAVPTNPVVANWAIPTLVFNLSPSAGGKVGWVNDRTGWKAFGAIDR